MLDLGMARSAGVLEASLPLVCISCAFGDALPVDAEEHPSSSSLCRGKWKKVSSEKRG